MTAHIAVLFINYGPYHLARLQSLHELCQQNDTRVTALELARTESTYAWRADIDDLPFSLITLLPDQVLQQVSLSKVIQRLFQQLNQLNPDTVAIAGYNHPALLAALVWCRLRGKPAVLMSASWDQTPAPTGWQRQLKRMLIGQYKAALVGGTPQKRCLENLGMSADQIFVGYNVVNNAVFHPSRIAHHPNPCDRPFFLMVVRYIPEKNLPNFLQAYAQYCAQAQAQAWDLVLCGNGPLKPQVDAQIAELNLGERIHQPGFLQQAELMPYFAHAQCLLLPSISETWGLVINEAMAAGLPVLVSNKCGCHADLLVEGETGFTLQPEDPTAMAEKLLRISSDPSTAQQMGAAALQHIQKYAPETFARGLFQAAQTALANTRTTSVPLESGSPVS
jgi:1,2-diacylglycerol 3-alpha-glucosyltransferase